MLVLARVERLDAAAATDKEDKLLRDHFLEIWQTTSSEEISSAGSETTPPTPSKRSEMKSSARLTRTDSPKNGYCA